MGAMPNDLPVVGMKATVVVNALVKIIYVISIKHAQQPAGPGHGTQATGESDFAEFLNSCRSVMGFLN